MAVMIPLYVTILTFPVILRRRMKLEGLLTSLWSTGPGEKNAKEPAYVRGEKKPVFGNTCVLSQ